ncbi:hypothetical protein J3F83DRAFT_41309 [Trichoderma novae-zelandiae]
MLQGASSDSGNATAAGVRAPIRQEQGRNRMFSYGWPKVRPPRAAPLLCASSRVSQYLDGFSVFASLWLSCLFSRRLLIEGIVLGDPIEPTAASLATLDVIQAALPTSSDTKDALFGITASSIFGVLSCCLQVDMMLTTHGTKALVLVQQGEEAGPCCKLSGISCSRTYSPFGKAHFTTQGLVRIPNAHRDEPHPRRHHVRKSL